jgi:rhamnose transport system ATP-binding protein
VETLLRLTDVAKSFGGVRALKGVSLDVRAGEVHALVGENGAGKSTLIKIVTGAYAPDAGRIEVRGQSLSQNDPQISRAMGIACIYQQPALLPDLTVSENVSLRLERGGPWRLVRWGERRRRTAALLARVGADVSPDALAGELSMPQQQLVEIAAAVGSGAKILILDEPTASIGEREVGNLFRVIRELRGHGVGMIYISHRLEELSQVADRVTVLRDGAEVATRSMAETDRAELIRLMVGRPLDAVFPKVSISPGDVVLEARDLSCRGSGVFGVNLAIRAGEILGLAGLVGAGRTELARVLFGLTPADGGRLLLRGQPVTIDGPATAVRFGIAYVPEDRRRHGVVPEMPLSANVTLAVLRDVARRGGFIDRGAERRLAATYVERLSIRAQSVDVPVADLSGGNQQKVALARWLAAKPSVIILDEPTQGVDVGAKAEVHRLMGEMASRGMAIVMISSELPEVLGMSDRVAVMRAGTVLAVLDRAAATQEKILELALGGGHHAKSEGGVAA